jgi:hypothetical protein
MGVEMRVDRTHRVGHELIIHCLLCWSHALDWLGHIQMYTERKHVEACVWQKHVTPQGPCARYADSIQLALSGSL